MYPIIFLLPLAIVLQILFFFFFMEIAHKYFISCIDNFFLHCMNFILIAKIRNSVSILRSLLKASGITLLIAASVWILDITNKLCSPTGVLQGHAIAAYPELCQYLFSLFIL